MEQNITSQVFDRKFVTAASVIGTLYATVVVILGAALGKEAAGVAGVALTALATGIFKQFETLRFKAIAESEAHNIKVPSLSFPRIVLVCFSFMGFQMVLGLFAGILLAALDLMPKMTGLEDFIDLLTNWKILVSVAGLNGLSYFGVAYIVPKAFRLTMYSDITIGALLSAAIQGLAPLIPLMIKNISLFVEFFKSGALWPAMFWLFYVGCAFIGARLSTGKKTGGPGNAHQCLPADPATSASLQQKAY